jgi:hypothetical protein
MPKTAGYSGTPLIRKLGIKEGFRLSVVNEPGDYWSLLGKLPSGVEVAGPRAGSLDFIHGFVTRRADLEKRMPGWRRRIVPTGMIWVSWPKKASGVTSDVTEDVVRAAAFANKLVDVKVCAVDEIWSGLKLVIRREDRPG